MSSGPGSSGKPWPRLIASLSRASCDIASKIVTGRSANTLFMEVMAMISRRTWSADPQPSRPVFHPPNACRRQSRPLAPRARPSPTACRNGTQKPLAFPLDPECLSDRSSTEEPRPRRDRPPPPLRWARGHRPEGSGLQSSPATLPAASNREPDTPDPPRQSSYDPSTQPARLLAANHAGASQFGEHHTAGRVSAPRSFLDHENQAGAASAAKSAGLDGHLRSDLDHPSARDLEIVGSIIGSPAERDEQVILPARHSGMRRRLERTAREKERGRHDIELPPELSRDRQRLRHVRRFHETEPQRYLGEDVADLFQPYPLRPIDARGGGGLDGQNDVLLVQHLVVLEAVHERSRRARRIAGEEHGCARNALGRPFFQHRHQFVEWKLQLARFLEQQLASTPPGVHQKHHDGSERQRHPAAFQHLQEVRGKEGQIEKQERRDQRRGRERRPIPYTP